MICVARAAVVEDHVTKVPVLEGRYIYVLESLRVLTVLTFPRTSSEFGFDGLGSLTPSQPMARKPNVWATSE